MLSPFAGLSPFSRPRFVASGGGGIALIFSTSAGNTSSGVTSSAIDTSGASLLVVATAWYNGATMPTVSDSKSNTWIPLTLQYDPGHDNNVILFYAQSPTVGAGHTFTVSGSSVFSPIAVAAFSNVAASALDTESAGGTGAGTVQPGSITPVGNNELFVTVVAGVNASASIDSSFVKVEDLALSGGNYYSIALAYKVQTVGGAENPTWTISGDTSPSVMAAFLPI